MYDVIFAGGGLLSVLFLGLSIYFYHKNDVPGLLEGLTGYRGKRKKKSLKNKGEGNQKAVTMRLADCGKTDVLPVAETAPLPEMFDVIEDITVYYTGEKVETGGIN